MTSVHWRKYSGLVESVWPDRNLLPPSLPLASNREVGEGGEKNKLSFFFKLHFYEGINSRHRYLIFFSPPLLLKICFIATRTELQGLGFNASYLVHLNILTVALFHFSLRHVLGKSGDLSPIVKLAGTTGTTGSISDWNTSIYSGNYSNRLYGSQS